MARAKYADSAIKGSEDRYAFSDELPVDEFFPEVAEEQTRLDGGIYRDYSPIHKSRRLRSGVVTSEELASGMSVHTAIGAGIQRGRE